MMLMNLYILDRQELSKRMAQHRKDMRKLQANRTSKLYDHMRTNGVEHYKILLIKEYTDISKDRLQKREFNINISNVMTV